MMRLWIGVVLAGMLLWSGCGSKASPPVGGVREVPSGSADLVVIAVGDLARRLSVHASLIAVSKVEPVDWPDSSLGCPQPDMLYTQVVTPGYRIVLSAQAQAYEYHSDKVSQVVSCTPTARP